MRCVTCGTSGDGSFCSGCGAPLEPTSGPPAAGDPSDAFWGDDEPTNAWTKASRTPAQRAWRDQGAAAPTWEDWQAQRDPVPVRGWVGSDGYGAPGTGAQASPFAVGQPGGPTPWAPGPTGEPPSRAWPLAIGVAGLAAVLVLTLGGGLLWFLTSDDDTVTASTDTSTSDAAVTSTSTSTSTSATTSAEPTTTTVTSTATSTSTTTSAPSSLDRLNEMRDDSLARLSTDDQWAVTLSAKQDGTRDARQVTSSGSHVFRLPDIVELHEGHERDHWYADVYLLKAQDLGSTQGAGDDKIWMTIVDPGFLYSRDDAELWCELGFPHLTGDDLDNACYPRQLSSP